MNLIDRDTYRQELEKAVDRNLSTRPNSAVLMSLRYTIAKLDDAPTVDAIPVQWLYDLAEKKESEKDIKLSLMIKGVVAVWRKEQEEQNEKRIMSDM